MHYLILNFKTYPEASGEAAMKLAAIVDKASRATSVRLVICPQAADIYRIREKFPHMSIWAQHIDAIIPGRNTGWTSPTTVVMAGATGTIINHSEHTLSTPQIHDTVNMCKQYHLVSCLALPNSSKLKDTVRLHSDFITYEPPQLISGENSLIDVDITVAEEFITEAKLHNCTSKLILGAGIRDPQDFAKAVEIGYAGVLLASGFVKSDDPEKYLAEMVKPFTH